MKKKLKKLAGGLIGLLLLTFLCLASSSYPSQTLRRDLTKNDSLHISVDPRNDLIAIAQYIKKYMADHPVMIQTDRISADIDYPGGIYNMKDWDVPAVEPEEYLNRKESMNRNSTQKDDNDERAAMKKLDFVIGQWKGEGWMLIGPDQRYPFSVTELYSYRCNGLVVDGEGRFRPQGVPEDAETNIIYGLGMIYFDDPSGEYRMWHCGGTGSGFVFTQKIEIDVEQKALHYINKDANGETYKFGFAIDEEGILTARSERQRPDGTWYTSMEFRMRKVE